MISRPFLIGFALFASVVAGGGTMAVMMQQRSPWRFERVGGPFELRDVDGGRVTERDLLGKPSAIYFGFTFCPEVCPATLFSLSSALGSMGPLADRLNVTFVTIDPERDTAADMKAYLGSFDPRIRGLVGSTERVADMAERYHVHVRRVASETSGYTMEHTATIMLFDKTGRLVGGIDYGEDADAMAAKLTGLVLPKTCRPGAPATLWERSVVTGTGGGLC
jgi:protein SCO1/2